MIRITPEMVLEAYERTGLKPARGDLFPKSGCACGLGAYATLCGHPSDRGTSLMYLNSATSMDYVNSFGYGFDGSAFNKSLVLSEEGYEDGQAAWEAVKHLADPEELLEV